MISYIKKNPHLLLLGSILLIGILFRTYQLIERFEFAHDGDLYSWIIKDIVVNQHPRLIGQLTSAPGIFIGGLFYYLLIPFFFLTNMDPIGAVIFAILIGLTTIVSLYFVLSKLFKTEVGLLGAFLYAVLLTTVNADRWVVPTITTNLWVIWYFYCILKIVRGEYKVLLLLGILIGLIWHVHIALIPALIAVPAAVYLAKKLPNFKQVVQFSITLLLTSLPLLLFEVRHGFGQLFSLISNFFTPGGESGLTKLIQVLNMVAKNINRFFLAPQSLELTQSIIFMIIILLSSVWLIRKKLLLPKESLIFLIWILGVIIFFGFSSSPISEYYFANIEIIFLTIVSMLLFYIYNWSVVGKILVLSLLSLILIKNAYFMVNQNYYNKGYLEKKSLVDYIIKDAKANGYPCIGITYITTPGENVGFRYFFYLENQKLVHPSLEIPVYNIVIPDELALGEVKQKFGHIGIIPPTYIPLKEIIEKTCQGPNTNLTDPMFGYVE